MWILPTAKFRYGTSSNVLDDLVSVFGIFVETSQIGISVQPACYTLWVAVRVGVPEVWVTPIALCL